MTINVFEQSFKQIDQQLIAGMLGKASSVIQLISPVFAGLFVIYVMLITFSYLRPGAEPEIVMIDLFKRFFGWAVIISCSLNYGFFSSHVIPIIQGIPDDLAKAISGSDATTVAQIDSLATIYVDAISEMWKNADGIEASIIALFNCVILIVSTSPFFLLAAGYIVIAKLFTVILLVLAPIYIGCALFPQTKNYTYLWFGQIVNLILLQVLFQIVAGVMMSIMTTQNFDAKTAGMGDCISVALMSLLFTIIAIKIPEFASALGGGASAGGGASSLISMASNVSRMMSKGNSNSNSSSSNKDTGGAINKESGGK